MSNLEKYRRKTIYLLLTIVSSGFFAVLFQPILTDKALDVLVNIYSILAGFLVGVIALIGDPSSLPNGSWRVAESATKNTFRKLSSTKNLLHVYLVTLFAIFSYKLFSVPQTIEIIKDLPYGTMLLPYLGKIKSFVEQVILFLSFVAFSYSFTLPNSLFNIQKMRVEKEIENRRKDANIK
ncbi:hypothetical protein AL536_02575 [Vibrio fluvialis]|uniref:Uncharacterized protein n=1 Tax=Vibrio fluvialis TaxID=676 RepID=A0AAX2LYN1_VIBFL|nr:hypothetical protein [Vibrio fluvialis]AMF92383.1 hypothetical protein AL536_02575 [Vibrio fluvialis]EKO4009443.1 hypothetical protein [Vibrio fluvialis]MBY8225842.1 hypothetical protein [Vibrio fluvialis]MCE7635599.1 hypothetical protein [Vibrio fluvialis]SUQ27222.1 Uncharacterised protein [Vibrio fluvialis]